MNKPKDQLDGGEIGDSSFRAIAERAVDYAREAGRLALAHHRMPLGISYKSKRMRDPVTAVDKEIEAFLRSSISRDFPGHGILGEEGTGIDDQESDFWWVLDPLDGTTNFINGLPFFAVSIGVLYRLKPVAAAIFSPVTHLESEGVFHAFRGGGAFLDQLPLRVINEMEPSPGRLVSVPGSYRQGFKIDRELRKKHGDPRVMGSIALELCLTAAGVFQFAVFGGPKIWDAAAGVLIAQEAGGAVLVGDRDSGGWRNFEAFTPAERTIAGGEVGTGVPAEASTPVTTEAEALRRWVCPIVTGSPAVVSFVADHLAIRPRSVARGRSGSSRAGGKRDSG